MIGLLLLVVTASSGAVEPEERVAITITRISEMETHWSVGFQLNEDINPEDLRIRSSAIRTVVTVNDEPKQQREIEVAVYLTDLEDFLTLHATWGENEYLPDGGHR